MSLKILNPYTRTRKDAQLVEPRSQTFSLQIQSDRFSKHIIRYSHIHSVGPCTDFLLQY